MSEPLFSQAAEIRRRQVNQEIADECMIALRKAAEQAHQEDVELEAMVAVRDFLRKVGYVEIADLFDDMVI